MAFQDLMFQLFQDFFLLTFLENCHRTMSWPHDVNPWLWLPKGMLHVRCFAPINPLMAIKLMKLVPLTQR